MNKTQLTLALLSLVASGPLAAQQATVTDPVGDFNVPFYTGVLDPGLDVTSFTVAFDGTNFNLGATMAGPINPAIVPLYVIGVNTGAATSPGPFATIGNPNVIFNRVIIVNGQTETGSLVGNANPLVTDINGNMFTVTVPLSFLASTGFAPRDYGFNLWPRVGLGLNSQIADFAPNNATLSVAPEPGTWMMMILGFGFMGMALRSRKARFPQAAT
jgi:hypothetical protein